MWGDGASTWCSCALGDGGMEGGRGVGEVGEQGGREERRGEERRGGEGRGGSPGSAQPLTQEAHPLGAAAAAAAAVAVTGGSSTPAFILRGTLQIQPTSLPGRGSHADIRRRCGSTTGDILR